MIIELSQALLGFILSLVLVFLVFFFLPSFFFFVHLFSRPLRFTRCSVLSPLPLVFCFVSFFVFFWYFSFRSSSSTQHDRRIISNRRAGRSCFSFASFRGLFLKKNCCRFVNVGYFVILVVFGTVHRCSEKGPVPRRFFH